MTFYFHFRCHIHSEVLDKLVWFQLLSESFTQKLAHEIDGLIFQPSLDVSIGPGFFVFFQIHSFSAK